MHTHTAITATPAAPDTAGTTGTAGALPSRAIQLQGASNFRDLGGYAGAGGRLVRWRQIYRSDHLGSLTPQDVAVLDALRVSRVCDFRGVNERASAACRIAGATVHSLPIEPTIVQRLSGLLAAGEVVGEADTVLLMQQTYRGFVQGNTQRFAALFGHLLESGGPLVFHCTAGKDRTGFAAALLLSALGVARETIMQDYLLTNDHLRAGSGSHALPPPIASVLFRVQEPFLAAAFEAVDEAHGSLDNYLARALGVGPAERARLHQLYLQ